MRHQVRGKQARCHSRPSQPPAAAELLCSPHRGCSEPAPGAGTVVGSGGASDKGQGHLQPGLGLGSLLVASSSSSGHSCPASVPEVNVIPPEASQTVTKHPLAGPPGFPLTSPQPELLGPAPGSHRVSLLHPHQRVQGAGSPGDNGRSPHSSVPRKGTQNESSPGQEARTACVSPYCPTVPRWGDWAPITVTPGKLLSSLESREGPSVWGTCSCGSSMVALPWSKPGPCPKCLNDQVV